MLIHGLIDIQDMNAESDRRKGRPLRSCLLSKKVGNSYYLCVKNSVYPNCINYRVADLDQVHSKFAAEGKLSLRFKQPKHLVLLQADDVSMLKLFLRQLQDIVSGKNVVIGARQMPKTVPAKKDVTNRFSPTSTEFVAIDCFDRRILNMRNLNKLVLENCVLPNLPEQIGHLPLAYLSLSGSKLGASQYERDTLWNWMTVNTINGTLATLKMDSINLQILPFEILYLEKLQILSICNNKLMYLPQYIGELKKLQTLFIANNTISYFPDSLYTRTFIHLDISNNKFMINNEFLKLDYDHILSYMKLLNKNNICRVEKPVIKSLSHLSFSSVVENCIKFKRQDIPRTLWHYFNVVGRCIHCHQFVLPDYSVVHHTIGFPSSSDLIKNHTPDSVHYQSVVCRFKCIKTSKR